MTDTRDIRVEVLIFEGCPHADSAMELVRSVAATFGSRISIERVEIDTPEKAAISGFLGSPSIRVNGVDVEGKTTDAGALCCRTYEGSAGVPDRWLIEASLLHAVRPKVIVFLCVANSARSQMAEGIARSLAPRDVIILSAGSEPTSVRPHAIEVLREIGIDISTNCSKSVEDIDANAVDAVITLCAEEVCPTFSRPVLKLHWGLPDPATVAGGEAARLHAFREVRDELRRRLARMFGD